MLAMRFFAFITLISAFLLFLSKPFDQRINPVKKAIPTFVKSQQRAFKDSFDHPQNANIAWAIMTGEKFGISPKAMQDFKDLELNFFFSPTGIHLAAILSLLFFLIKKLKYKKTVNMIQWGILIWALFLPFLAIKRIIFLRLLIMSQRLIKRKFYIEILFLITFGMAFLLGHFKESPLGYILSFLYIGTFISLSDKPKIILILGLFSSHLLIAFFSGNEVSLLSIILGLPIIALFSFFLPFVFLYFFTFKLIHFNWIEAAIRLFILIVHWGAKLTHGSFMSSTLFLILVIWILLLRKKKRYLVIALLLHGNIANSPAFFYSRSYSVEQREFVHT
ncbi:MAG: hypothetical protein PHY93_16600 [Bacteriovorax sp.]|nr:hypothetical protein [Bacteriovorax sp.]